jgi:hypothetical protein
VFRIRRFVMEFYKLKVKEIWPRHESNFRELGFKIGPSCNEYKGMFQLRSKMTVLQGLKPPFLIGVGNIWF